MEAELGHSLTVARSYSGAYIRSLGVYVPYLQLPSMGITPFSMSEGNNSVRHIMCHWSLGISDTHDVAEGMGTDAIRSFKVHDMFCGNHVPMK